MRERLRREIARGTLPMVDLSEALTGIEDDRYVDVAHYAPATNAALAAIIIHEWRSEGTRRGSR